MDDLPPLPRVADDPLARRMADDASRIARRLALVLESAEATQFDLHDDGRELGELCDSIARRLETITDHSLLEGHAEQRLLEGCDEPWPEPAQPAVHDGAPERPTPGGSTG